MNSRIITSLLSVSFIPLSLYLTAYLRVVPIRHILFVIVAVLYACFTNTIILRTVMPPGPLVPRPLTPMKHAARLLFPFTLIFSLFVPVILLYVAGTSVVDGKPTTLAHIVGPPLFLVMSQISLETVGFLFSTVFTLYVRLGVTTAFVAYRIPVMFTWYQQAREWAQSDEATLVPPYAVSMTQAAAVLNIVFWTFALLCFLLLYCIPAVIQDPPTTSTQDNRERQKTL